MAVGKFLMQTNDGAIIGLTLPDGLGSGERTLSTGPNLSGATAYHLLSGDLSLTIQANKFEATTTTTDNYTTSDYIFCYANNKLYDCILASTSGVLLTNTTYFTPTSGGTLTINNAIIPFAQGIDSNGTKVSTLSKNESITGLTYTQGKNYVYCDKNGAYGVTPYRPRYLESELVRTFAGESPEYYDVVKNKWFSTSGQGELVTNGTFDSNTTGWTTTTGFTTSVVNGTLNIARNITTTTGGVYQAISTVVGKQYKLIYDIDYISGGVVSLYIDNISVTNISTTGKQSYIFTAQNTSTKIEFYLLGVAQTGTINLDNISVYATDLVIGSEITTGRNYLNHVVYADNDGVVLYVEELPKIEYKYIVKANEYRGKNACTAWANIDGTTTPPTIIDSYNISSIIRLATGDFELSPTNIDLTKVSIVCGGHQSEAPAYSGMAFAYGIYNNKIRITTRSVSNTTINPKKLFVQVFGGKN